MQAKHIVIIAGEESGDMHAAVLIKQLKHLNPTIKISGIGGRHMDEAGAELVSDLARYGVTGITEVVRYLGIIRKAFNKIKAHLCEHKPDLLILVDYPGFNLRLAQYAKKDLGIKVLYYISPQIWAWKAKRIHLIKECVDRMAVILPFEKQLYEQAGVPVSFVGHPLVDKLKPMEQIANRMDLALPLSTKIFALLPGSRSHEIERHMPVLRDTAQLLYQRDPQLHFVIPIAGTVAEGLIKSYFHNSGLPVSFVSGKALNCMAAADFVIVASGTASLECALLEKPMCIIYKSSFITYVAAAKLMKVKFLGLCNLLMNKMAVPEFLQYDCNAQGLFDYITHINENETKLKRMTHQLSELKNSLSSNRADCTLLDLVLQEIT